MKTFEDLADGWQVWTDEPDGRSVLAYRPDVFNTRDFPAACMPTLYLTDAPAGRRPASPRVSTGTWRVTLFFEPDVRYEEQPTFDSRDAAVDAAVELADRFARGELDYRGAYQVPRAAYLDRLDELTGREP